MAFNINKFKSGALPQGGARPSQFDLHITGPLSLGGRALDQTTLAQSPLVCRAASLPASAIGTIEIPYFGRKIKLAGDRVVSSWQVTVMNDEDFGVRSMFEMWSNAINTIESNVRLPVGELSYKSEIDVNQYGKNGIAELPVRSYKMIGAFPTIIGPIQLDWNATDQIEVYDVTFEMDYWLPDIGNALNRYSGQELSA